MHHSCLSAFLNNIREHALEVVWNVALMYQHMKEKVKKKKEVGCGGGDEKVQGRIFMKCFSFAAVVLLVAFLKHINIK